MGGKNVDRSLKCSHKGGSGVCVCGGVFGGFNPFLSTKRPHNENNTIFHARLLAAPSKVCIFRSNYIAVILQQISFN